MDYVWAVIVKLHCKWKSKYYAIESLTFACLSLFYEPSIPTSLLHDCASVLHHVITKIINLSLSTGNFPMAVKHSLVTPLLKKSILTKKTYLTTDPSQTCRSYPSYLTELSLL